MASGPAMRPARTTCCIELPPVGWTHASVGSQHTAGDRRRELPHTEQYMSSKPRSTMERFGTSFLRAPGHHEIAAERLDRHERAAIPEGATQFLPPGSVPAL